jgi:hypothetical protein
VPSRRPARSPRPRPWPGACTSADVVESAHPRLAQLLALVGSDLNDSPCLDALGGGGDVGDPKLGKSVDKCRAAIVKAGQIVADRTKGLERALICATDHAAGVAVPRLTELLQAVGLSFGESFCD